jgi:hypothetical protein
MLLDGRRLVIQDLQDGVVKLNATDEAVSDGADQPSLQPSRDQFAIVVLAIADDGEQRSSRMCFCRPSQLDAWIDSNSETIILIRR